MNYRKISPLILSAVLVAVLSLSAAQVQAAPRLDTSFGNNGIATKTGAGYGAARSVAETPSGRLLITGPYSAEGSSCSRVLVASFLANGRFNPSFGTSGLSLEEALCQSGSAIAVLPGGRSVVGTDGGDSPCVSAISVGPGGARVSWPRGSNGLTRLCYGPSQGLNGNAIDQVATDERGRILLAGSARWGNDRSAGLLYRLKPNGKRDSSLVGDRTMKSSHPGLVSFNPRARGGSNVRSVRTMGNGKILIAGDWAGTPMVARLTNSGSLDRSFARRGMFRLELDGNRSCRCSGLNAMVRDYQGRILALGYSAQPIKFGGFKNPRLALIRLSPNGKLDRSFGNRGIVRFRGSRDWTGTSIVVQRDGRIVVGGSFDDRFSLIRFQRNGKVDRTFFRSGIFSPKYFGKYNGIANSLLIDKRGRIVAAGGGLDRRTSSRNQIQLIRIFPN